MKTIPDISTKVTVEIWLLMQTGRSFSGAVGFTRTHLPWLEWERDSWSLRLFSSESLPMLLKRLLPFLALCSLSFSLAALTP